MSRTPFLASLLMFVASCARPAPHPQRMMAPPPPPPQAYVAPVAVAPPEAPPTARLPADARPAHYTLALEIVPTRDTFAGTVAIDVDLATTRNVLWLHGKGLSSKQTVVMFQGRVIPATYEEMGAGGVVAVRPSEPVGPGRITLNVAYEGRYTRDAMGIFRVDVGGDAYVHTQLEAIAARQMFPCFDEPAFKTPFDVVLFVPEGMAAAANTKQLTRAPAGNGLDRLTFATTAPLPTYLLALTVGPLDIVDAPLIPPNEVRSTPLAFRGIAAKGQGSKLAYALTHTPAILASLERYFGTPYPYDKLDIVAVPDRGGAMENAGLVTFRDWLLLVDEKEATLDQRRAFASVMAHELAHQWFGDLVTMPWWDDIWLNESFATWMGARTVDAVFPENEAPVAVMGGIFNAMDADSLASARRVREDVATRDDISNAFDAITYQKGGSVLAMFERWLGPETFQRGVQSYLRDHAFGSATADDLFAALSVASGRDVASPMRSFLFQTGVPFVEASVVCDGKPRLHLSQSRYVPLGSLNDPARLWQLPLCARFGVDKTVQVACTLLTAREGDLPLGDACPDWVMPNADAAGYFRFSMPPKDLDALLQKGRASLSVRERLSLANALEAALGAGTVDASEVLKRLLPLASDTHPFVAMVPMRMLERARLWLDDPSSRLAIERLGRKLYAARAKELGWVPRGPAKETPEMAQMRPKLLTYLALSAREPAVRAEAKRRGMAYLGFGGDGALHSDAVDANLAGLAIAVAVQEGDAALFEHVENMAFASQDPVIRSRLIGALGYTRRPELATRARALAFDSRMRVSEMLDIVGAQTSDLDERDEVWAWLVQNVDALAARLPERRTAGLSWFGAGFCDDAKVAEIEAVFGPRSASYVGGPRNLAGAKEAVHLCAAQRGKHEAVLRAWLEKQKL